MPQHWFTDWMALIAALAGPLAVAAALAPFRAGLTDTTVALVLVVIVVAVAAFGNRGAGALAALSAAAWFDFFFTQPYDRFTINNAADIQAAVLMLVVGLAVSQLAARVRQLRVIAVTDSAHLTRIHNAAELARSTRSPGAVIEHVKKQLIDVLDLHACRFEHGSLLGHPPRLMNDGTVVAGRRRWDTDHNLPEQEIELRTYGNGRFYGRFLLQPNPEANPPLQARLVAVTLADLAGAALDAATHTPSTTQDSN